MSDFWSIAAIGLAFLLLIFIGTWRLSVGLDNYSLVDVAWALSFAPLAGLYAALGQGWGMRRLAVALVVGGWSLRLGVYLWRRVAAHHPREDARYAVLRDKWRADVRRAMLKFFLAQALLVWLLMLPVLLICRRAESGWHPLELAGLALWVLALLGEGIADAQLARFKSECPDPAAVCERGLWRYSRHPNYFFQSLLWWGLFLTALPAPGGWWALLAPLAMLHFLLNVTGIPLTEKLAVEKRGEAYRAYQLRTSAFFPWFPKTAANSDPKPTPP